METRVQFYVGAVPVLLALTWAFWGGDIGQKFSLVFMDTTIPDSVSTRKCSHILKGHMERFGNQIEKTNNIKTLDYFPNPEEFYREYVRKSVPLVVRGALKHWPAVQKWENETYLREKFGHRDYVVKFKNFIDEHHPSNIPISMTDFLNKYKKEKIYMDSRVSEEMAEDLTLPDFIACGEYMEMLKMITIFLNSGWSSTDIHLDVTETIFAQVTGGRQWILTTPMDGKYLYSDQFPHHAGISPVNQEAVDLMQYPDVSKIAIYNTTLGPGDIIYIPEGWWHQARVTGGPPNIAIAVFLDFLLCLEKCPPSNDSVYTDNCIKMREQKPTEMKCAIPLKGMTIRDVYSQYRYLKPNAMVYKSPYLTKDPFEYHTLKSGYSMPTLGLGLVGLSMDEADKAIRHALKSGYRLFDTDSEDETEATLGSILDEKKYSKREDIFIIVKVHPKHLGRDATKMSLKRSLERLRTDYIDLVLMSAPSCDPKEFDCKTVDEKSAWHETWEVLEELNKSGTIRSLGLKDFTILSLEELLSITTVPVSVLQARFDLMSRNTNLRQFCDENDIRFMAHGLLGFKWTDDSRKQNPILGNEKVKLLARKYRISPASVLIVFALDRNITVAPRSSDPLHITSNKYSGLVDRRDDQDMMDSLEDLPHIP